MRGCRSVIGLALAAALIACDPSRAEATGRAPSGVIASADFVERWQNLIEAAGARFGMPTDWIRNVMRAESGGRTELDGWPITSSAGAMGLMQVMPETYETLRRRYGLGNDPYDPRNNVMAGAAYLREMYDLFGYPNLFAAYNAGPGRLRDYLLSGRSLPDETLGYIAALDRSTSVDTRSPHVPSGVNLFFTLRTQSALPELRDADARGRGLFVPLRTSPASSG
jgi:soluble lytic murein transglycosylase-like protein